MLSIELKGKIAWVVTKRNLIRNLNLRTFANPNSELKKEIGNLAKETGFSKEEILQFYKEMGEEILRETHDKLQSISFEK